MWKSHALWPDSVSVGSSSDDHPTKEHAVAVCEILKRDGFGGEGKIFPKQVFVEDPQKNVTVI